eukprot:9499830-Pyramimonas_sp.AAC.1
MPAASPPPDTLGQAGAGLGLRDCIDVSVQWSVAHVRSRPGVQVSEASSAPPSPALAFPAPAACPCSLASSSCLTVRPHGPTVLPQRSLALASARWTVRFELAPLCDFSSVCFCLVFAPPLLGRAHPIEGHFASCKCNCYVGLCAV